jgi:hypothetical protein
MCDVVNFKGANPDLYLCEKGCKCPICIGISCHKCDDKVVIPMRIHFSRMKAEDKANKKQEFLQKIVENGLTINKL